MVSPPMPSGSRLVAIRCTLGQRRKTASAVLAQPPIRCSQLSSTIRTSCGARASSRVSRTGRPGCPATPSAWEMAGATASSSKTAASSTSQTPSPDPSSSSAATCRPSLVFPDPPAPVSVTRREDPTSARTSDSSRSRPMNVASWAGRLFGSAGLPSERSGGNPALQARHGQLEDLLRAAQVLQPVHPQVPAAPRPAEASHAPGRPPSPTAPPGPHARPPPPARRDARPGPPGPWPSSPPHRYGHPSAPGRAPRLATHRPPGPAASPPPPPRTPSARRTRRKTRPPGCSASPPCAARTDRISE